jgi:hypothetical protein
MVGGGSLRGGFSQKIGEKIFSKFGAVAVHSRSGANMLRSKRGDPRRERLKIMINSTSTCVVQDGTTTICSTEYNNESSTKIVNGFTAGELITNIQIFLLIALVAAIFYHISFRRVKIKNQ